MSISTDILFGIKKFMAFETRAVVGQRSSPDGYILYCNIFIIKKFKMYNNNKTQTQKAKLLKHEI